MKTTFEDYLKEWFIGLNEYGGVPITKDNCEDLFENYLASLDGEEYIKLAEAFGRIQFLLGERTQLQKHLDRLNNKIK